MALLASLGLSAQYSHTIQAEKLDRGVVAVKTDGGVFVSWRSLIDDDKAMTFDVYRDGVKVNAEPLKSKTNLTDAAGTAGAKYTVKAIVDNKVVDTSKEVAAWETPYMRVHLDRPEGGISPAGGAKEQREYTYTPDDISVGDVDGDGEWELIVKWFPTNQADNGDQVRTYVQATIILNSWSMTSMATEKRNLSVKPPPEPSTAKAMLSSSAMQKSLTTIVRKAEIPPAS